MKTYEIKNFNIPELKDISSKTIEEHLKLYSGYVKHTNLILEKVKELSENREDNSYLIGELRRRFGFEFDGMRNHEYYFESFEGGSLELGKESKLFKLIEESFGSFENWLNEFKYLAKTRGVGWAILYFDDRNSNLLNTWVDEQQSGHLMGLKPVVTLDMWEHSFVIDFPPSEKAKYIEAFFDNLNWKVISDRFDGYVK